MIRCTFLLALSTAGLLLGGAPEVTPSPAPTSRKAEITQSPSRELPIHIDGGSFQYRPQKDGPGQIVFTRGVEAKQGTATAKARTMTATVDTVSREITGAVAQGDVRVREGNRVAVADKAEFIRKSSSIVLTGSARLWEEGNLVEGKRIVFNLETGTVDCEACTLILDPDEIRDTLKGVPGVTPPPQPKPTPDEDEP